ncbi:trypsin-like peptidase domain-containing protein [Streptomyces sp. NPDC093252]|uniref:trypsin-like peptidase domain-containing protein n=1 Tax=Streptomyces sp. NPDC093252 TaxID=3154980 RepID=UPI003417CF8A
MAEQAGRSRPGGAIGAGDGPALVHLHDLAGRPRGLGFLADHHGTLITSHEAVDGLGRLVLRAAGDRACTVTAADITPLPGRDLALVRTDGLGVDPLPIGVRDRIASGTYVRLAAGCWREARVLGTTEVTYTATDRFHLLDDALELAIGTAGRDALRLGGGAAGGPVLDTATGTVIGVVGTALRSGLRDSGFAVPLRPAADGPLVGLLARNAATVPAYGADLNLAGVLELTATSVGCDAPADALASRPTVVPVERAAVAAEFAAFTEGGADVLALVGPPGSGRTTELAAHAARRGSGRAPAPTLWLRGADLQNWDASVADAAARALARAARIVAASRPELPEQLGDLTPARLARLARAAGRSLLILLDGPEEMPPVLAHRLGEWTEGTARWLRESGARMVVGCRAEYWENAGEGFAVGTAAGTGHESGFASGTAAGIGHGTGFASGTAADTGYGPGAVHEPGALHEPGPTPDPRGPAQDPRGPAPRSPAPELPAVVPLGDLTAPEAREARLRYGIPEGALTAADARHPLTLRLLSEIRAALPDAPEPRSLDRYDVLAAHLDLMCLRIAVRIAAENGVAGRAVRRLATRVAGQVHEAARGSLGPGQGELDRAAFEAVFPWGPAPRRLGAATGWASAVLAEGLLVPAGAGYRFAHEELADWIQGMHLDLDEALRALVHRRRDRAAEPAPFPVPHHRIGPVVQSLLLLARQQGTYQLALKLEELVGALDAEPDSWWAVRLLGEVLRQVPDATPYVPVLRLLADRIVLWRGFGRPVPAEFGPGLWTGLAVPGPERLDLLRRLVLADPTPQESDGPRFLDAVAALLAADPTAVQPLLTRWFDDERALPATPHATVATAAQALLHTHRRRALDALTEALADRAHPRADELLATLAEEEPSAICRAVDRWAHDPRPERHETAMIHGLRTGPHARTDADRDLLRHAALSVLAGPADAPLHGAALGILVRDPRSRARHLPKALARFGAGDPRLPAGALLAALNTHPEPVLDAFRTRLASGGGPLAPDGSAGETLRALLDATPAALARRVAVLVAEAVERRPECAGAVAQWTDTRLETPEQGRTVVFPLVTELLEGGCERARGALAGVLGSGGAAFGRPLRGELRELLLAREREPGVLDALLRGVVAGWEGLPPGVPPGVPPVPGEPPADRPGDRELARTVRRIGTLLVRTPEGAACFDRGLVDLGRHVPGFAAQVAGWLTETPGEWTAMVGPSTRRMIGSLAGVRVPA